MLGCQWLFKYKTDKHSCLQNCKAGLVVCGNQQKYHGLLTKAITLAITFLRILLVFTAKFDQKTIQLNNVNAFLYANLDKTVFMCMSYRYGKNASILRLNKALYCLQRFLLLWQQKFTNELKKLGF